MNRLPGPLVHMVEGFSGQVLCGTLRPNLAVIDPELVTCCGCRAAIAEQNEASMVHMAHDTLQGEARCEGGVRGMIVRDDWAAVTCPRCKALAPVSEPATTPTEAVPGDPGQGECR